MSTEREYDVTCLGLFCVDLLLKPITRLPPPGEMEPFQAFELTTGGCANNTAIALARLRRRVAAVGLVGRDHFGDLVLKTLTDNGVDGAGMARHSHIPTSLSIVLVAPDGERSFLYNVGANAALSPEHVPWERVARSHILHVAGVCLLPDLEGENLARVLRRARELGILTSVDTALNPDGIFWEALAPAFPHLDLFLPSLAEASRLVGTDQPDLIAEALLAAGVGAVMLKMGEKGCYVATREEHWLVPAFPVRVVDTCGAGDSAVGGFLAGQLAGWSLVESARLANGVGATCVTALGALAGLRNLEETIRFMDEHPAPPPRRLK